MQNLKTGTRVSNPKEIADAFSEYYKSLYNLKNYANAPQPSEELISDFLASVSLPPTLPQSDLTQLNQPFMIPETVQS